MKNWIKKHPILLVFLLIGSVPASLNYSGFCMSQGRWLSDEEFLINAIRYENRKLAMKIEDSDESIKSFLEDHPQCCILSRRDTGMGNSGIDRFIANAVGLAYATVEVQYSLSDTAHRPGSSDDYGVGYLSMNSCGKVVERLGETKQKKYTRFSKT